MRNGCLAVGLLVMLVGIAGGAATEETSATVAVPSKAELLFQAGANYQNSNQSDKAIAVYEQLVKEFPEDKWAGCALTSLGELYFSKKDEAKAEEAWKRAARNYPDAQFDNGVKVAPVSLFQLAYLYENKGKIEEAENLYREIVEKYPGERAHNQRPFTQLVDFRMRLIRDQKSFSADELAAIDTMYQEAASDPTKKGALKRLQEIMEKHPKSNKAGCAAILLAQAYADGGNLEKAEQYLIAAQKDYADCYFANGAAVAPLAAFYQGLLYRGKADQMFAAIAKQYPDAIDLQGRSLQMAIRELTQSANVLRPATSEIPVHRPVKKVTTPATPEPEKAK